MSRSGERGVALGVLQGAIYLSWKAPGRRCCFPGNGHCCCFCPVTETTPPVQSRVRESGAAEIGGGKSEEWREREANRVSRGGARKDEREERSRHVSVLDRVVVSAASRALLPPPLLDARPIGRPSRIQRSRRNGTTQHTNSHAQVQPLPGPCPPIWLDPVPPLLHCCCCIPLQNLSSMYILSELLRSA